MNGSELRDEGASLVESNTPDDWRIACDKAIQAFANTGQEFTAEDVRAVVGDPPNHPNAMGARFLAASKARLIERVAYRKPARASSHASVIAVWRRKT